MCSVKNGKVQGWIAATRHLSMDQGSPGCRGLLHHGHDWIKGRVDKDGVDINAPIHGRTVAGKSTAPCSLPKATKIKWLMGL